MFHASPESVFPPQTWAGVDDVVIVGAGLAGLYTALKLAPRPVTVLAAAPIGEGAASAWAQGGIAAAVSPGDSVESHLQDTLVAGAGLSEPKIVDMMVREAPQRIDDLLAYGVPFDRDAAGHLLTSREGAHSAARVVRVGGDGAGAAIMAALVTAVRATPSIRILTGHVAEELAMDGGTVAGVIARRRGSRDRSIFRAPAVVLAVGGTGALYAVTTNPLEATGAGIAMAARAGAIIADAEFVQFHPTALAVGRDPAPLATEALRGAGAILVDAPGRRIMDGVHPLGDLAPRDVVARAIHAAIIAGRKVFLDARASVGAAFPAEFPAVTAYCRAAGIDPVRDPIPVAPAAHYHMGGVLVDARGRSSVDGLWACGETASTGAHGANRLASNSLLEAVVFAARIAEDIQGLMPSPRRRGTLPSLGLAAEALPTDPAAIARLRATMITDVGVVRDRAGLTRALATFAAMAADPINRRLENRLVAATLIAAAALQRTESRGAQYRRDYPAPDPAFAHRTYMTLAQANRIAAEAAATTAPILEAIP